MTTVIPDLVLPDGYVLPARNAVNFRLAPPGEEPGEPGEGSASRYVGVAMLYQSARRRGARRVDSGWRRPDAQGIDARAPWSTATRRHAGSSASWNQTRRKDLDARASWTLSVARSIAATLAWSPVFARDVASAQAWASATAHLHESVRLPWAPVYARDAAVEADWNRASRLPTLVVQGTRIVATPPSALLRRRLGDRLLVALREASRDAMVEVTLRQRLRYAPPQGVPLNFTLDADDGGDAVTVLPGFPAEKPSTRRVLRPGYVPPLAMNTVVGDRLGAQLVVSDSLPPIYSDPAPIALPWSRNARADQVELIVWGHGPQLGPRDPPPIDIPVDHSPGEPPPVPIPQKVYIVMNSVEVVLLPEGTPIAVNAVDAEASLDTWCWSFRLELADPAQVALLKPSGSGPKSVRVTINGYPWTAIIEGRDGARTHASTGGRHATVSGRSQTALLAGDYVPARSYASTETRSAQQLAVAEIADRSLPFDIDWSGVDWLVPAGAWSYQDLAPIDAISQIVAARGGVLQSAPADARLVVRSRYPVSPWNWSSDNADIALPIDWVTSESAQQQSKPMYDAVFVIGQQQGVMAKVTRQGSAGDTFAAQVVDALIVTPEVAAERGRTILSDRGVQDLVSQQIPLFPPGVATAGATGLYLPGMLVDVIDPEDRYQALAVGVSISARRGDDDDASLKVWQNVSLERHLSDAH